MATKSSADDLVVDEIVGRRFGGLQVGIWSLVVKRNPKKTKHEKPKNQKKRAQKPKNLHRRHLLDPFSAEGATRRRRRPTAERSDSKYRILGRRFGIAV